MLWFGDERGYNATKSQALKFQQCCGLVMKEDITQQGYANQWHLYVVVW